MCNYQRRHTTKIQKIHTIGATHTSYLSLVMKLELINRVSLFHALFNGAVSVSRLYRVGLNHIILMQLYTSVLA
jgi:hypothetical protein